MKSLENTPMWLGCVWIREATHRQGEGRVEEIGQPGNLEGSGAECTNATMKKISKMQQKIHGHTNWT